MVFLYDVAFDVLTNYSYKQTFYCTYHKGKSISFHYEHIIYSYSMTFWANGKKRKYKDVERELAKARAKNGGKKSK